MRRLLMSLSAFSLLAACSGGGDATTPPPASAGITLSASTTAGTIARGASATTSLTLGRTGSFVGSVSLTAEGAPSGVSIQFAPQSLGASTNSSTATISADQSASAGNSTITLRASGTGVTSQTVSYTLTVLTPAITVSAGSGSATAVQGTSATVPITITRTNGAAGAVTLTVTGLPTDATASFTPGPIPSTETTSTMTVVVAGTTPVGSYAVTISAAAAGVTTQTATVQLAVTAPSTPAYTISATPAALTATVGGQATTTLTIAKSGGFAGNIALSLEGAPAGVSGVFAPNPATATTSTLTLSTTGAVAPGAYNLTVRGTTAGLTDRTITLPLTVNAAPGVTVALAPAALSIAQSSSGQTVATITRVGGLTGDIAMTTTGAPSGMTVAFAPTPVTATSSTITVTVGSAVATGSYPLTITGTGTGNVIGSATLTVTVTTAAGFTLAATNSSVVQSATGSSTVTITRTGGYANNVDLTATNLPSGVTAAFAPTSVAGTSSTLTFTATAGATPGTYANVTVNGTGAGAANQATTLTLTVAAGGGGGGAIAWQFCDATRVPLWLAYRNGTSGGWTRVTPSGNTFSFSFSGSVGSVAMVMNQAGGGFQGTIYNYTASEMAGTATSECTSNPGGAKTLSASFAGLTTNASQAQSGTVNIAGGSGTATTSGTAFQITNVQNRVADLFAYRLTTNLTAFSIAIDRVVLRRNVNYGDGATVPVIDFAGAESFAPATATVTAANAGADAVTVAALFQTANGTGGTLSNFAGGSTILGVPSSKTLAGDFHLQYAGATSADMSSVRAVIQYNRDIANRSLTFGAVLAPPTITAPSTMPYARLKIAGTWPAEYGDAGGSSMTQGSGAATRAWTIAGSRGYYGAGASQYEFELFDFSGVTGFLNTWGLSAGVSTQTTTNVSGGLTGTLGVISEGSSFKAAARVLTVTP